MVAVEVSRLASLLTRIRAFLTVGLKLLARGCACKRRFELSLRILGDI
jgi:hypothetical protein